MLRSSRRLEVSRISVFPVSPPFKPIRIGISPSPLPQVRRPSDVYDFAPSAERWAIRMHGINFLVLWSKQFSRMRFFSLPAAGGLVHPGGGAAGRRAHAEGHMHVMHLLFA